MQISPKANRNNPAAKIIQAWFVNSKVVLLVISLTNNNIADITNVNNMAKYMNKAKQYSAETLYLFLHTKTTEKAITKPNIIDHTEKLCLNTTIRYNIWPDKKHIVPMARNNKKIFDFDLKKCLKANKTSPKKPQRRAQNTGKIYQSKTTLLELLQVSTPIIPHDKNISEAILFKKIKLK